jgi:hypothetical protein
MGRAAKMGLDLFVHVLTDELPKAQRKRASHIMLQITMLALYVQQFESALGLIDHAEATSRQESHHRKQEREASAKGGRERKRDEGYPDRKRMLNDWSQIAPRDGALTLYQILQTMDHVEQRLRECPALADLVDIAKMQKAMASFDTSFQHTKLLRHAVAHDADRAATLQAVAKTRSDETEFGGRGTVLAVVLPGRRYQSTGDGGVVLNYELTRESLDRVHAVVSES